MDVAGDPAALRRAAGWAFVCGLCLAALVAIVALLSGSFDDTDERVIATSLGFSVFSSTGAAGTALRGRERPAAWAIGTMALVASVIAFMLLLVAVWSEDLEGPWRAFGVAGLIALWSAHAALVAGASKPGDSAAIKALGAVAVGALAIDTTVGVLAVVGALDDVDADGAGQVLAALLVLALLATVLPPILRRLNGSNRALRNGLAAGVGEVAERLGAMDLPPQARAEVARLRELVREAGV
jgi:hypothetical protein